MLKTARTLLLLGIIVATVGCDHVTKHLAASHLTDASSLEFLRGSLRFEYAENTGGFLSLGATLPVSTRTAVFTLGSALVLGLLTLFLFKQHQPGPAAIGWGFVLAGGLSNLFDRLMRGSVIDFVSVGIGPVRTGIFNVADLAILIGVIVVLIECRPRLGSVR